MKKKLFELFKFKGFISIIYYIALFALIWYLIIPHTSLFFRTNIFNPFWGRLNQENITLIKGESFRLSVRNINKRLTFSSTDIKVADVNIFGKVTAYRTGTTIIRVKYEKKVLKCRVRVIDINKKNLQLKVGKSSRLDIKGAWLIGVRWSSDDSSVAVVNRFGKVTGVSKGRTVIYGKTRGKTLTCTVYVE